MSKKLAAAILTRFVDTESVLNKTNASTGAGAVLATISANLAFIPDPNAQLASKVLAVAAFFLTMYKEQKN